MRRLLDTRAIRRLNLVDLLLFLALIMNGVASLWNVEPYHEGTLFPTAMGLSEGLSVFKDVNQQYGFLGPLLVSFFIDVFGNYLIVQRLFGFTLMIIIALLFYFNLLRILQKHLAKCLVLIWFAISPIWSWPISSGALSGGYWPNHIASAFVLFGMLLLNNNGKQRLVVLSGFCFFLSSQARMEFYFVWILVCIAIFLKFKGIFLSFVIGSLFGIALSFVYLLYSDAIPAWFEQTILVWTMEPPDVPKIGFSFFAFNLVNFLGVVILGIFFILLSRSISKITDNYIVLAILLSFFVLFLMSISTLINFSFSVGNFSSSSYVKYVLRNSLFTFVNLSVLLFVVTLLYLLIKNRIERKTFLNLFSYKDTVSIAATFGTFFLFHNFNPDYTHMTWPIIALGLITTVKRLNISAHSVDLLTINGYIFGIVFASMVLFVGHAFQQQVPYQNSMLNGLYGKSQDSVKDLDWSLKIIERYAVKRNMLMVCQTGLFSVNNSGYLGLDEWTWNQQPQEMIADRFDGLLENQTILACKTNPQDSKKINELLELKYIERVVENSNFTIYRVVKSLKPQLS